jgi:hypothetical protein
MKEGIIISIADQDNNISLDNMTVEWKMDNANHLSFVNLVITDVDLQISDKGFIRDSFPELENKAFQVGAYIANRIFIQTGVEAVDPNFVFYGHVDVFPETPAEEKVFSTHDTALNCCLPITWNVIQQVFQPPKDFVAGFKLSKAYANYTDGLRVMNPFLRYEQFYKVLEHFFNKKGREFDLAVSRHVSKYDKNFDQNQIEKLRNLRNRIVHPRKKGHLNPSDRESTMDVESTLSLLHSLVKILLQSPPGGNKEEI